MSKRHLEPDGTVVSRETTPAALGRCRDPNMPNREETLFNGCSSIQWRTDGPSCTSPQGGGNLKRPRAFALQRFDFSLLKDESTGSTTKLPSASTSVGASTTQCSTLSTSTAAPHQAGPGVVMTTTSTAPTMILPFLFLGSQNDALSKEFITGNKITHVLNASATCPKSPFVSNENFLRIPVNDSHTERLLPYFEDVANFLDGCCKSNGRALVHCLAGISRSPTFVIAYVMRHLRLPQDEAYRFVKMRRLSISPNFNFLGQLLEFESILQQSPSPAAASHLSITSRASATVVHQASPRKQATAAASLHAPLGARSRMVSFAQSPTTALAKLSFEKLSPTSEDEKKVVSETKPADKLCSDKTPKSVGNKVLDKRFHDAQKYLGDSKSRSAINSESSNNEIANNNQSSISRHLAMQDKFLLKPQTAAASPVKLTNPLVAELAAGNVRKRGNTGSPPTNSRRVSPPTRPSSIAISSLQFDFSVLKTDLPLEFKGILPDSSSPYSVLSCMADSRSRLPVGVCSRDLLEQVESACRSRSFSDIPAMTSTRPLPCGVIGDAIPGDGSAGSAIATRAWHSALEARASNGSLSSVSSHGSLHGSREMVQVS